MNVLAAIIIAFTLIVPGSNGAVHGVITLLLFALGVFAAINVFGFLSKRYFIFSKLIKESTKRMNVTGILKE